MRNVQGYEHVLVENTAERKDIDHAIKEQFDVHISYYNKTSQWWIARLTSMEVEILIPNPKSLTNNRIFLWRLIRPLDYI